MIKYDEVVGFGYWGVGTAILLLTTEYTGYTEVFLFVVGVWVLLFYY
jgi:hypothetical protein